MEERTAEGWQKQGVAAGWAARLVLREKVVGVCERRDTEDDDRIVLLSPHDAPQLRSRVDGEYAKGVRERAVDARERAMNREQ